MKYGRDVAAQIGQPAPWLSPPRTRRSHQRLGDAGLRLCGNICYQDAHTGALVFLVLGFFGLWGFFVHRYTSRFPSCPGGCCLWTGYGSKDPDLSRWGLAPRTIPSTPHLNLPASVLQICRDPTGHLKKKMSSHGGHLRKAGLKLTQCPGAEPSGTAGRRVLPHC